MKQMFRYLVEVESITQELDKMDLSADEKLHLAHLVDSSLHHTILDAILSELQVDNIEEKIKKAVEDLKQQLQADLRKAKNLR